MIQFNRFLQLVCKYFLSMAHLHILYVYFTKKGFRYGKDQMCRIFGDFQFGNLLKTTSSLDRNVKLSTKIIENPWV